MTYCTSFSSLAFERSPQTGAIRVTWPDSTEWSAAVTDRLTTTHDVAHSNFCFCSVTYAVVASPCAMSGRTVGFFIVFMHARLVVSVSRDRQLAVVFMHTIQSGPVRGRRRPSDRDVWRMPCQRSPDVGASDPLGLSSSAVAESLDSPDRWLHWPHRRSSGIMGDRCRSYMLHLPLPPKRFEKTGTSLRSNRDENS